MMVWVSAKFFFWFFEFFWILVLLGLGMWLAMLCFVFCVCDCSCALVAGSGGATHKGGGPPKIKKKNYSTYFIYILKNVACENRSWPSQILSYFNGALKRKKNYIKII